MINPALALFYLVFFPWLSFAQGEDSAAITPTQNSNVSTTGSVSATGIKIILNYNNLVATITKTEEPLVLYDWADIATEVLKDATAEPFGKTGTAPRYDRWPLLTTDAYDIPQDPSFTIRFFLIPVRGCATRLIDKPLLEAVAGMFQQFTTLEGGMHVEFTGTIDLQNTPLFSFQLINVNRDVAESYRSQESITREDSIALQKGHDSIVSQTVKNDLLLFTGPLGALFYYTMNRAFDSDEDKRNAWLVPADFPRQWTQRQELDVLHANPIRYANFKASVLKPAFDSFKRRIIGRSRVIFIGHWGSDFLIPILRDVVKDLNLFSGPFYTIPLYGQGEEPPTPPQYSFNPMYPINIGSKAERRRMSGRNVPAVVPFYPYYYWDVNYTAVPWADQAYGTRVAQMIFNGEGPSLSLGNSTTAPAQLSLRFVKPDQRQRLHARQLEGTNATTPIPKPPTAPDDDTVDMDPVYDEDPLAYPDIAEQACVLGEPIAANSNATRVQSPAAGVAPVNGDPVDGGVATT